MSMSSNQAAGRGWLSLKGSLLVAMIAILAALVASPWWRSQASAQVATAGAPQRRAEDLSTAFRQAAEVATPTVVKITSHAKAKPRRTRGGAETLPFRDGENPFKGTPFEDFFKDHEFRFDDPGAGPREGTGSGVVIDRAGVILTNNHVVDGADDLYIRFQDGEEAKAIKVRRDKQTDMALVWIDPSKLSHPLAAAKLGDSDQLQVGDWVLAIGTPFGLEATVSAGIISAKGRNLNKVEQRTTFLQTDAAINPGNSGGPLVNLNGEVVGINTAIYTETGTYAGIGFAVPSNTAKWVVDSLMKGDSVHRAWIGVGISEIDPRLAEQTGVKSHQGVMVTEVRPNSPGKRAGLQDGDVILDFAGQRVGSPSELQRLVERAAVGPRHELHVMRDGKTITLNIQLEALPDKLASSRDEEEPRESADDTKSSASSELGLEVTELTSQAVKRYGYEAQSGVLISKVEAESVAHREGLRPGMLITRVGNQKVTSVEEFEKATKGASLKKGVMLQVRTPNGARFLVLKDL